MNFLIFSTAFLPAQAHGGVPFSTYYLARALVRLGHSVRVITSDRNGSNRLAVDLDKWIEYKGIPVLYCRSYRGPYIYCPALSRFAKEQSSWVDVVITSSLLWNHGGLVASKLAEKCQVPHLCYTRGLLNAMALQIKPWRKKLFWWLQGRWILNRAAAVVALNTEESIDIKKLSPNSKVEVIPNGVDPEDLQECLTRAELEQMFPALKEKRFLLYLGRLHSHKGLDCLVPAFFNATKKLSDSILVICGPIDPQFQAQFQSLRALAGSTPVVLYVGPVAGALKNSFFHYCQAFVLPSRFEAHPMAALEAMAAKKPVIITAQCRLPLVAKQRAGWEVTLESTQLEEAIILALSDEKEAEQRGLAAFQLIKREYSWENVAEKTVSLAQKLLTKNDDLAANF